MSKVQISKLIIKDSKVNSDLVNIDFNINNSLSLIGESGSGKSLTLKALLNLLPNNLKKEVSVFSEFELNAKNVSFIPQNPFTSLSPMTKIDKQFFCDEEEKLRCINLVGLESWVLNRFPSQLSGGQLQRLVIAIALSTKPKLLLLDEPTTALDTQNKEKILNLLKDLKERLNLMLLYVTHDIFSIEDICEEILILKKGKVIERGLTKDILYNPKEEYTKKLLNADFKNKAFRK